MPDLTRLDAGIAGTVVLAGVGCDDRGDDAAGVVLAGRLRDRVRLRVIDCGDRPEDFTGDIAEARPDTVVIVDAVDMGLRAGALAVLDAAQISDAACETHRASLVALMRYLEMRTGARVLLLGVQPGSLAAPGLTPDVGATLDRVERWFVAEYGSSVRESGATRERS